MLVKNWMSKDVITIDVNESMTDATKKLKEHDIRMLPVTKRGELVGVITDRDLKRASASNATTLEVHELLFLLSKVKVGDIMTKSPITVPLDYTIGETAELLLENKISGVPVIKNGGQLSGVITEADIFRAMISLTGLKEKKEFSLPLSWKTGLGLSMRLPILSETMVEAWQVSLPLTIKFGTGIVKSIFACMGLNGLSFSNLKKNLNRRLPLLYMVDFRENEREVYAL